MSEAESLQLELFELSKETKLILVRLNQIAAEQKEIKQKVKLLIPTKRCRVCREVMGREQFYEDDRYADGMYPYCRECKRVRAA